MKTTDSYRKAELSRIKHDDYGVTIQFVCTDAKTRWLTLTESEFNKIKSILTAK